MNKIEKATKLHNDGFNCSQSVVGVFCESLGIDEITAMKFAGGFGGGLCCGEVCGAVSGAAIVIGLKYGQYDCDDKESKEECKKVTSQFLEEYKNRNNEIVCRELLGFDIRDKESLDKNLDKKQIICSNAIKTAIIILEEMGF